MTSGHAIFITHRTKPGQRDVVRDVWLRHMAPAVADNPGHRAYYYCFDDADGDVLRVFQLYVDETAAADFLSHPGYAAYLEEVGPLLAGPPDVHAAAPQWSKPER